MRGCWRELPSASVRVLVNRSADGNEGRSHVSFAAVRVYRALVMGDGRSAARGPRPPTASRPAQPSEWGSLSSAAWAPVPVPVVAAAARPRAAGGSAAVPPLAAAGAERRAQVQAPAWE